MDENLKKIIPFVKPYKTNVVWNVFYNILYALFSTLSFISLIPMMKVLFNKAERITEQPVYKGIMNIGSYGNDYLYYYVTKLTDKNGPQYALILVVALVITTFLFIKISSEITVLNAA